MNSVDSPPRQARAIPTSTGSSRRRRVVVADANPEVRRALHAILCARGLEAVLAGEGMAAVRRASPADVGPNEGTPCALMIAAADLPGLDGLELLQRMGECRGTTPVVLMVPCVWPELVVRAEALGAFAVLSKPVCPVQLDRVLARLGLIAS